MLSRRQLRNKVLQALYAHFQSGKSDLAAGERELFRSIDKVYDLYILLLNLLCELADEDQNDAEDLHTKFFPKAQELNAKHRLFQLRFIAELRENPTYKSETKNRKVSWQKERDLVRKFFLEIKKSEDYSKFLLDDKADEQEFLLTLIKKHLLDSEALINFLEESNIYWHDDFDFVCHMTIKTIKSFYESSKLDLFKLYKDEQDDKAFTHDLFSKTILHSEEFAKSISEKTKNWDVDRIAMMDIIILKMALAELITFPGIPVKVTINEYIDISKEFSTPKSKLFVNGVLDKLAQEFMKAGKIVKTGRGLVG